MKTAILLVPFIALVAQAQDSDAVKKAYEKLHGTWTVQPVTDNPLPLTLQVIFGKDNQFKIFFPENKGEIKGTYKIDPGTNPPVMDLELANGTFLECIYTIENDTFKLCFGNNNIRERPAEFPKEPSFKERYLHFKK